MAKSPTNTDIITEIRVMQLEQTRQHKENSRRFDTIEQQVRATNGRVKALETQNERRSAVEEYKEQQRHNRPERVRIEKTSNWDWKVVLTIILTLATAVVAITGGKL